MTQRKDFYVKTMQADRILCILEDFDLFPDVEIEEFGVASLKDTPGYGIGGNPVKVTLNYYSSSGVRQQLEMLERILYYLHDDMEITSSSLNTVLVGMSPAGVVWRVRFYALKTTLNENRPTTIEEVKEALK